jgi:hypothetical protein
MVALLNVGCHVEGSYGSFLPSACNPDGSQVKRWKRLEVTILEARGEKRYSLFDSIQALKRSALLYHSSCRVIQGIIDQPQPIQ